jgi:hypothetical protein
VLPEAAEISELSFELLLPARLPGLWEGDLIKLADLSGYFAGGKVVKIQKDGYEEPATVPKAEREVFCSAVAQAVEHGKLWLTSGQASILAEPIPSGLLTDDVQLQPPPPPIPTSDVMPSALPDIWAGETTTALAIAVALSQKASINLPWATVRDAIDAAIRARMVEPTVDSATWPCDYAAAQKMKLRRPLRPPPPPPPAPKDVLIAEAELKPNEIQDLAEKLPDIRKAAGELHVKFHLRLELDGGGISAREEVVKELNLVLAQIAKGLSFK